MAKKYYWLKLKDDFFDDDTISYIEEQKNGVYYVNFYLKLCLKSLKTNGKLARLVGENLIPYDENSLSKLTNTPVDTVLVAMKLFESIGLVNKMDSGEIYMVQINEMIGGETDKASAMRRLRAEKKSGNNVTKMLPECYKSLPECYTEIDIEKDKDTDKEIDIHTEIERESHTTSDTLQLQQEFIRQVYDKWKENDLPISNISRDNYMMFQQLEVKPVLNNLLSLYACKDDVLEAIGNAGLLKTCIDNGESWYKSPDSFKTFIKRIDDYMPGTFQIEKYMKKQTETTARINEDEILF